MTDTQVCIECKETKPVGSFEWQKNRPNPRKKCKTCRYEARNLRKENKASKERKQQWYRENKPWLKDLYGITIDEYNKMLIEQNHRCFICSVHEDDLKRALCVDHCHQTGHVRRLLCSQCNVGLGNFKDSPDLLLKAIQYLQDGPHFQIELKGK